MDIRVLDIDMKDQVLYFLFQNNKTFEAVKNELKRIGYPVEKVLLMIQNSKKRRRTAYDNWETSLE